MVQDARTTALFRLNDATGSWESRISIFDSPKELLDQIRLGEDSLIEVIKVRFTGEVVVGPHRDSLADEQVSFAYTEGGACVLGRQEP